jgi:peptidoglycan glycosyltransferase
MNAFTASLAARRERTPLTILREGKGTLPGMDLDLPDAAYEALRAGMVACVNEGSGRRCRIEGLPIAGKTGTAQVQDGDRKSHLAWFTAFAPAFDPEIAVTVMVREPFAGRSYGGGSDAAPIARKIFTHFFADR